MPPLQHKSQASLGGHLLQKRFNGANPVVRKPSNSSFDRLSIKLPSKNFESDDSSESVSLNSSATFSENEEEELKVPAKIFHRGSRPNYGHKESSNSLTSIITFGNNESSMRSKRSQMSKTYEQEDFEMDLIFPKKRKSSDLH